MQSAIDRILDENFNSDIYGLSFSVSTLEIEAKAGTLYEGSFDIFGPEKVYVEGRVSSTGLRMECTVSEFAGSSSNIPFVFDTVGLSAKDEIKGEIRIISNQGEYLLPYNVKIQDQYLDTSLGNIKNLFHFTNLAKTNWMEAVALFTSDNFDKILTGVEGQYLNVYHCLKTGANKEQALEEFLLYIRKKTPADFLIAEPDVRIENLLSDTEKNIVIQRNGWGYSDLWIETDSIFLDIKKTNISQEDFDGNLARIPYAVKKDKLHEGKNFGRIKILNAYNEINISVCVINSATDRRLSNLSKNEKHLIVDMIKYYEAFRCRKISSSTWLNKTSLLVEDLCKADSDNKLYDLYRAQILITTESYNEARWILERLEGFIADTTDDVIYCYYYYLTTLLDRGPEHAEYVTSVVEQLYSQNEKEWRLFWLLSYLSEDYARSPMKRWEGFKRQFELGSSSPVIFAEAYQIVVNNPTIMSSIEAFEKQLLIYMAKKELLTADIIEQYLHVTANTKNYDESIFGFLKACYKTLPNDEVLKAIVSLLINVSRLDAEAHEWYLTAVNRSLRITKLYEYYMMSLDLESEEEIPKIVLMYFAFDSSLDVYHNSFLYAYVYKNRFDYESIYENYRSTIERFVSFQLINGVNNEYLSYLYKNMITQGMITEDVAKGLSRVMFISLVVPNRDNIRQIKLKYENLKEEYLFKVPADKKVYMPIYGNNMKIALISEDGDCYVREEEYQRKALMSPDLFSGSVAELSGDLLFDLYICEHGKELRKIDNENVNAMKRLSQNSLIDKRVQRRIRINLLNFYFDEDRMDELDEYLSELSPEDIEASSVGNVIRLLIQRGFYDKAYSWTVEGKQENLDAKLLMKLCSHVIIDRAGTNSLVSEDKALTALVYRAFQENKFDKPLLNYLSSCFEGTSRELKYLIKASEDNGIDTTQLMRQYLEQILYSGAFVAGTTTIYCEFAKGREHDRLCQAFLAQTCFDYFVREKIIDSAYIKIINTFIETGIELPFVCKLTYAKYYSEHKEEADDIVSRRLITFLREILIAGMYFPFFKEYASTVTFMHRFLDKTIIEYRVKDGVKATIHYLVEKDDSSSSEYIKEEMKNMYCGICAKQFVLFFGERLQYYISEKDGDEEKVTESGTLTNNDMEGHDNVSRYTLINDISIARTLGDDSTMDRLLVEFFQNEYLLENMFGMSE